MLPCGVAAGTSVATVAAGIEVLEEGGTAADAAVAASLASCVAESVMTGLLGGGHAIYWDGADAWNLDCFVDVLTGDGAPPLELKVPLEELVHYAVGPGTCAVPGFRAGWRRCTSASAASRRRLVEPALRLAREGVVLPPAHAACLAMLGPVFTMQPDGQRIYAPGGQLLETGETLAQPGLETALQLLASEGADSVYEGSIAALLTTVDGVPVTAVDLRRYEACWAAPAEVAWLGRRVLTRAGLSACGSRWQRSDGSTVSAKRRVCTHYFAPSRAPRSMGNTTNLVTCDSEGPRVRADVESRPRHRRLPPRPRRAAEQHARRGRPRPSAARARRLDGEHDGADAGARGRARARDRLRRRHATVNGARRRRGGDPRRGLDPVAAVGRPRFHRAGDVVNAEPGVDERALEELAASGLEWRWPGSHHYFGESA